MKTTFALGFFNKDAQKEGSLRVLEEWGYVGVPTLEIVIAMGRIREEGARIFYVDPRGRINQCARQRFLFNDGNFAEFCPLQTFYPPRNGSEIEMYSLTKEGLRGFVENFGLPFVEDKVYHKSLL